MEQKILEIQNKLRHQGIDGWLIYDHHGSNKFARELLDIPYTCVLTRRFFYWIPQKGAPCKILHRIEEYSLDFLPGDKELYLSWQEFEQALGKVLKKAKKIAMEYSPCNHNPYVSKVDGGTIELVRSHNVEVISSDDLLQSFTSVLDDKQIASHLEAAEVLVQTVDKAWEMIGDHIRKEKPLTEYDVQQFILSEFLAKGCITEEGPTCSVNENTALPHYMASKNAAKTIQKGDFILIDLWCKKECQHAVYADITRVAVADSEPTPHQQEIFEIVYKAQEKATDLIRSRIRSGKPLLGSEVDDVCRQFITEKGYGAYFTHRTGHNIDTSVHGAGAHLDNLETSDSRKVLPGSCFSIEPGIYLPGKFGIRLEYDLIIHRDHTVQVTGGVEANIHCLL